MPDPAAVMLARGGVVLADSADASRCYSEVWRSSAAARQAFHRAKRAAEPTGHGRGGDCHAPLRRAVYQRAGAGKRPASLAFDPAVVPLDGLRSWLEERVGPLARFEAEQAPAALANGPTTAPEPNLWPARLRLAGLAARLYVARPKREHGVRALDWAEWEAAGRAAAELPTRQWAAWRSRPVADATAWAQPGPLCPDSFARSGDQGS